MAKTDKTAARQEATAAYLEPHREAFLQKLVALSLGGDPSAMKLMAALIAPPPAAPERTVKLPALKDAQTLTGKVSAVLDAVAAGEIGAATGEALMKSLQVLSNAVQVEEFAGRITALERAAQARHALPSAQRVPDPQLPLA